MAARAKEALGFFVTTFGWFYLLATFTFLVCALYFGFSRYGAIRLGNDDEEPAYPFHSWLAMLFSAGMGIGLVFWGVAEPLMHFQAPPMHLAEAGSPQAARLALRYSFFHWGLHPWAIYTVIALALAYAQFRKGEKGLISVAFRSLLGNRVEGAGGKAIDTLATIATVFGVATSLGLGTLQIAGGLTRVFGTPNTTTVHLMIIAVVTVIYMTSAMTGLDRGILILSNVNLGIAALLLVFMLAMGPTSFIVDVFTTTLGDYLGNLVPMSFRTAPFSGDPWVGQWTLFYWAWWIAWAPFVGTFIARVSRGRTIREFVTGVLLVPAGLGALWFSVFGGAALYLDLFGGQKIAEAVASDVTTALFMTLEHYPLGWWLSLVATLLIITFFITSADSATFVLGMLTTDGKLNPGIGTKLVWGVLQSSIAAALLLSGGLQALQTASIVVAFPFSIVMVMMVAALQRSLKEELRIARTKELQRHRMIDSLLTRSAEDQSKTGEGR